MNRATGILALLAVLLAGRAGAMVASSSATLPVDSLTATTTGDEVNGLISQGWMVNGGYFFKDTMFNNGGRGGPHVDAGRAFAVNKWVALWAGIGALQAEATQRFVSPAGSEYRATWKVQGVYADAGVVIPWMPFPIALAVYRQSSDLSDVGVSGPLTGRTLSGSRDGYGVAVDIHIMFEWFLHGDRPSHRGLGFVLGYIGFIDLTGHDLATADAAGGQVVHPNWKAMRGESLRGGLEYEF